MAKNSKPKVKLEGVDLDKVIKATTKVKDKTSDDTWYASDVQSDFSKTSLQMDKGEGEKLILKFFHFNVNPETFEKQQPTAQFLLNTHLHQIEEQLWVAGLKIDPNVEPRVMFSKDNKMYHIVVGSRLARGKILSQEALTLPELANVHAPRATN